MLSRALVNIIKCDRTALMFRKYEKGFGSNLSINLVFQLLDLILAPMTVEFDTRTNYRHKSSSM